jgi:hypothetical protein
VALCQAIPGATAMQVSAYVGLRLRGVAGAATRFLDDLQRERPALRIIYADVGRDAEAQARLQALAAQHGVQALGVPAFSLHGELHIGFVSADATGD